MNLRLLLLLFVTASLTASLPAAAQGYAEEFKAVRARGATTTLVTVDNDSLLLNRDDGFYTSGFEAGQRYDMRTASGSLGYGWRIGQGLYTNSDIKLKPAQFGPPDHPYAAWLYAGGYREQRNADGSRSRFGVDIGCLGPCAGGRWTQTNLHRIIHQPLPQGWAKQVKNEFGVVLQGEFAPSPWRPAASIAIAPVVHGRFGNIFTDAGLGLTLRAGQLEGDGLQAIVRIDATAVGYNATLEGGYFSDRNPHTVKPKRAVGEAELGALWQHGGLGLKASVIRRGNEIEGLPNKTGTQNFVRLQVAYTL